MGQIEFCSRDSWKEQVAANGQKLVSTPVLCLNLPSLASEILQVLQGGWCTRYLKLSGTLYLKLSVFLFCLYWIAKFWLQCSWPLSQLQIGFYRIQSCFGIWSESPCLFHSETSVSFGRGMKTYLDNVDSAHEYSRVNINQQKKSFGYCNCPEPALLVGKELDVMETSS